jgi:hypothetical protein
VIGGRRDQQDDPHRRAEERGEVDVDLVLRQLLEPLLERQDEQEGEEHLRAGHGKPVLLDELAPFLVELFRRPLVPPGHAAV